MKEILLKDNPDVSVILPVYNEAKYLAATLDSLCKQSYKNFELIVVNDGSTDESRKIMEHFSFDRRIKFIDKSHGGKGDALNAGHDIARGRFLTWCSPGNIYYNMYLDILRVALIQSEIQEKSSDFVYADFQFIDQQGNAKQNVIHNRIDHKEVLKERYDIGIALMYTRALWEKTGKYWNRPAENYQWCIRAAQHSDFSLVNAVIAGFIMRNTPQTPDDFSAVEDCKKLATELFQEAPCQS